MIVFAPEVKIIEGQVVFLAGPIQGAEDWQGKAIDLISAKCPSLSIANPRGDYSNGGFDYDVQVDWETHYLGLASNTGGILFWLAREVEHHCDRSYAQTTRFELGEWVTKYIFNRDVHLFIGIDPIFSGEKYLRKRIGQDCPEITIHSNLEDVCKGLVRLCGGIRK